MMMKVLIMGASLVLCVAMPSHATMVLGAAPSASCAGGGFVPNTLSFASSPTGTQLGPNSVALNGDVNVSIDGPGAFPGPLVLFSCVLEQDFTIQDLPTMLNIDLVQDYKLVLSNGSATAPSLNVFSHSFISADGSSINELDLVGGSSPLVGNGLILVNQTESSGSFILAPGLTYTLEIGIIVVLEDASAALPFPTPVATLEFGGITGFDGLTAVINATPVPVPSSSNLLALGLAMLGAKRLQKGRRLSIV